MPKTKQTKKAMEYSELKCLVNAENCFFYFNSNEGVEEKGLAVSHR